MNCLKFDYDIGSQAVKCLFDLPAPHILRRYLNGTIFDGIFYF